MKTVVSIVLLFVIVFLLLAGAKNAEKDLQLKGCCHEIVF